MKKIGWLPIIIVGLSTLALLVLFVMKAIDNNKQRALISQTQTAAVATSWAQQTIAAIPTETPTPTATATPEPTFTPTATASATPAPSPTEEPTVVEDCDEATFIDDVTIPDGTELGPNTAFTKTWRLLNEGTCSWDPNYDLVFVSGDQMSGPSSQQLINLEVPHGASIDVSVDLKAPSKLGTYRGNWMLRNANGVLFGIGPADSAFYLEIRVVEITE